VLSSSVRVRCVCRRKSRVCDKGCEMACEDGSFHGRQQHPNEVHAKLRVSLSPRQDSYLSDLVQLTTSVYPLIALRTHVSIPVNSINPTYHHEHLPKTFPSSQTYHPPTTPPPQPCHTTTLPLLPPRTSQALCLYRVRPFYSLAQASNTV
jgi:hypothetical protein